MARLVLDDEFNRLGIGLGTGMAIGTEPLGYMPGA
jgi:hypothetical protein